MIWPTYWLAAAMAVAHLSSLALAWLTLRLSPFPGQRSLVYAMIGVAWWTAWVAIEHASQTLGAKIFCAEMAWLGIAATPGFWLIFVWSYINGENPAATRFMRAVVLLIAVGIWAIALTNAEHHLLYREAQAIGEPPAMTANYVHGPLFTTAITLFSGIMIVNLATLLFALARSHRNYRAHYLGLALASLPPWLINILYAGAIFKVRGADLTPLSFLLSNSVLYWLLSRRYISDLLPIAQGTLLAAIPDPVLVLDAADRIMECNPAARRLFDQPGLENLPLGTLPELSELLHAGRTEARLGTPPRHFDVGRVPLTYAGRQIGRLILLRDVTHLKTLQEQLREQAILDPLTGLHNRRFFDELAPVMMADAQRSGACLAAAMIDIDHFKRLNDAYGHAAGDAVLRRLGAFLRQNVRQGDMVFRMGGEEFLLLLPHMKPEGALRRLVEWRSGFAATAVDYEGAHIYATFSAGVAFFPNDAVSVAELVGRADAALYQAKAKGRNRTMHWTGSADESGPLLGSLRDSA